MNIDYIVEDKVLKDAIDVDTGESIWKELNIAEIQVPEGTEIIGALEFCYAVGSIEKFHIPTSLKMIDSNALSGREIHEMYYPGNITDFSKIKVKYSPDYHIHLVYCNDGIINYDDDFYINELEYSGTVAECDSLCNQNNEENWIYRKSKVIHCTDGDLVHKSDIAIDKYLAKETEEYPRWLKDYKNGTKPNMKEVLRCKNVYYPGAGFDVQPIETFRKHVIAHLFVYADYSINKEQIVSALHSESFIRGYHCIGMEELMESDIAENGWRQHVDVKKTSSNVVTGYGILAVFEKNTSNSIDGEPMRFALLYLVADGVATYDALFANNYVEPYVLILQDHAFGGNYDRFGSGGTMEKIAKVSGKYPKYIECGVNTNIWDGYIQPNNVAAVYGGMHHNKRQLWELHIENSSS